MLLVLGDHLPLRSDFHNTKLTAKRSFLLECVIVAWLKGLEHHDKSPGTFVDNYLYKMICPRQWLVVRNYWWLLIYSYFVAIYVVKAQLQKQLKTYVHGKWRHKATGIRFNIGSDNDMPPDNTKLLPELILT